VLLTTPPVFRNKTPCRLVYGYHPFEGVWCFNLQSSPKLLGCPEDGDSKVERVVQLHLPHSWTRQPVRTHSQENDNLPCIFRNFQTLRRSRFYRQQDLPWDTKVTQLTPSTSPSLEANSRSASQEIPHILCYSQVRCRVPNSLSLVPILSQINPIHNLNPTS